MRLFVRTAHSQRKIEEWRASHPHRRFRDIAAALARLRLMPELYQIHSAKGKQKEYVNDSGTKVKEGFDQGEKAFPPRWKESKTPDNSLDKEFSTPQTWLVLWLFAFVICLC